MCRSKYVYIIIDMRLNLHVPMYVCRSKYVSPSKSV